MGPSGHKRGGTSVDQSISFLTVLTPQTSKANKRLCLSLTFVLLEMVLNTTKEKFKC